MKSKKKLDGVECAGCVALQERLAKLEEQVSAIAECAGVRHDLPGVLAWRQRAKLDAEQRQREAAERARAAKARATGVRRFIEERLILAVDAEETALGLVSAYSQWCRSENLSKCEHATPDEFLDALRSLPDVVEGDVTNRAGRRQEGFIGLRLLRDGEDRDAVVRALRDGRESQERTLADRAAWSRQQREVERERIESARAADVVNRAKARELESAGKV